MDFFRGKLLGKLWRQGNGPIPSGISATAPCIGVEGPTETTDFREHPLGNILCWDSSPEVDSCGENPD
jgi:hypothetical protein